MACFVTTSDVDECAEGAAMQECANTVGSFDCTCVDGYELAINGRAYICNGMYHVTDSVYTKHKTLLHVCMCMYFR